MAKPTEDVTWAESGAPVEPAPKRAQGYLDFDELPAQEFNWLIRALGRWILWLQALFDSAGRFSQGDSNLRFGVESPNVEMALTHGGGGTPVLSSGTLRSTEDLLIGVKRGPDETISGAYVYDTAYGNSQPGARLMIEAGPGHVGGRLTVLAPSALTPRGYSYDFPDSDWAPDVTAANTLFRDNLTKLAGSFAITFYLETGPAFETITGHNLQDVVLLPGNPGVAQVFPLAVFDPACTQLTLNPLGSLASSDSIIWQVYETKSSLETGAAVGLRLRLADLENGVTHDVLDWADLNSTIKTGLVGQTIFVNIHCT